MFHLYKLFQPDQLNPIDHILIPILLIVCALRVWSELDCRPRAKAAIITLQHWSCKISQVDQNMDNFLIQFLALFALLL